MNVSIDITDKEHITVVHDFLMTYPFLTPNDTIMIDYGESKSGHDSAFRRIDANALMYIGRVPVYGAGGRKINVIGDTVHRWQITFDFVMWRNTGANSDRLNVLESIDKMIRWINDENMKRDVKQIEDDPESPDYNKLVYVNPKLPRFSETDYESIMATGGRPTAALSSDKTEFRFSIVWVFETISSPYL